MGIPHYTKYKSSLGYKAIYNYAMFYLTMLMIIVLEVLEDPQNNQTNLWLECNLIGLNRIILNMSTKWMIDLRYRESQRDQNVGLRLTKYEAR